MTETTKPRRFIDEPRRTRNFSRLSDHSCIKRTSLPLKRRGHMPRWMP